jgi:cupin fold WbuC family metalloprotein
VQATEKISHFSEEEISCYFQKAKESHRGRHSVVLHQSGDYENKVINFLKRGTYMQPHLHPGEEKIEHIHLIRGECVVMFFNDAGVVESEEILNEPNQFIKVPAYKWHTYLMLTDEVITYETMDGVYDPATWKSFAAFAPPENTKEAIDYYQFLKKKYGDDKY